MNEEPVILGRSKTVDIELDRESGFSFVAKWWSDEAKTIPINFTSVDCKIKNLDGTVKLDLIAGSPAPMTRSANVATLLIPPALVIATFPEAEDWNYRWFFEGKGSGAETTFTKGRVRIT